jgi:hypothetical protein
VAECILPGIGLAWYLRKLANCGQSPPEITDTLATSSRSLSSLYARSDHDPDDIRVRLGGFDGTLDARITGHVWVGSKATWYEIEDSLPRYPEAISANREPVSAWRPTSGCS